MNNVFNKDTSIWVAPNWVASCWDVIEKDIIIRVGVYISGLEHCRKMKFRIYLQIGL